MKNEQQSKMERRGNSMAAKRTSSLGKGKGLVQED